MEDLKYPDTGMFLACIMCGTSRYYTKHKIHKLKFPPGHPDCKTYCSQKCRLSDMQRVLLERSHRKFPTILDRVYDKVDKTPGLGPQGECWEWRGRINPVTGYGILCINGVNHRVHRLVYTHHHNNGVTPPRDMYVMHLCDNKPCVNPDHLKLGTNQENVRSAQENGLRGKGEELLSLTPRQVVEMRNLHAAGTPIVKLIGKFPISYSCARSIINGKSWKHLIGITDPESVPQVYIFHSLQEVLDFAKPHLLTESQ